LPKVIAVVIQGYVMIYIFQLRAFPTYNEGYDRDKLPITIMQIALAQYLGFNLPQTMRGVRWILEMEMEMILVMM
jgi:hypothetical protein